MYEWDSVFSICLVISFERWLGVSNILEEADCGEVDSVGAGLTKVTRDSEGNLKVESGRPLSETCRLKLFRLKDIMCQREGTRLPFVANSRWVFDTVGTRNTKDPCSFTKSESTSVPLVISSKIAYRLLQKRGIC